MLSMTILFISFSIILRAQCFEFEWTDYTGFSISTGKQSPKLSPSIIGDITSRSSLSNIQHYRFFGWPEDREIAWSILSKSAHPQKLKFHITMLPDKINNLTQNPDTSHHELSKFFSPWIAMNSNVYSLSLGYTPTLINVNLDILSDAITLVHDYLQSEPKWHHIRLTVPFSMNILGTSYPVYDSSFKPEYKHGLSEIIRKLSDYDGFFGIGIYPFYASNCILLGYCLGINNNGVKYYNSMAEAQYDATYIAIHNLNIDNFTDIEIAVTETGWASNGAEHDFATLSNAVTYIESTLESMKKPWSPLYQVMVFFFELIDENEKDGGDWEQYFGLYDIDGNQKYWTDDDTAITENGNGVCAFLAVDGAVIFVLFVCICICVCYNCYRKAQNSAKETNALNVNIVDNDRDESMYSTSSAPTDGTVYSHLSSDHQTKLIMNEVEIELRTMRTDCV